MIPDWHPIYYQWDQLELPYYIPDTEPARRDLAARYTTISRLDQGNNTHLLFCTFNRFFMYKSCRHWISIGRIKKCRA